MEINTGRQMALNFTEGGNMAGLYVVEDLNLVEVVLFAKGKAISVDSLTWNDRLHRTEEGSKIRTVLAGYKLLRKTCQTR